MPLRHGDLCSGRVANQWSKRLVSILAPYPEVLLTKLELLDSYMRTNIIDKQAYQLNKQAIIKDNTCQSSLPTLTLSLVAVLRPTAVPADSVVGVALILQHISITQSFFTTNSLQTTKALRNTTTQSHTHLTTILNLLSTHHHDQLLF